ncbi:FKBP-type peptidyl-prolyl cis-trans isomerase [Aquirufa sp. HETE-40SA]
MLKYIFFIFSFFVVLSSCSVENVAEQEQLNDEAEIQNYITQAKLVNMLKTADGMYYSIKPSGVTKVPVTTDLVTLNYKLYLLDGTLIDSTNAPDKQFKSVVYGVSQSIFTPMIQLMKQGDKGTFLLPSSLAFGSISIGNVPANASLRAEVEVVSIRTETEQITDMKNLYGFKKPEITSSGMVFEKTLESTTEPAISTGKTVTVKYLGRLGYGTVKVDATTNKLVFDSKFGEGQFTFITGTNQVIKGFEEAVLKMKLNETAKVILPSSIAYGANGNATIPGYSPLYFEIEVVSVQ